MLLVLFFAIATSVDICEIRSGIPNDCLAYNCSLERIIDYGSVMVYLDELSNCSRANYNITANHALISPEWIGRAPGYGERIAVLGSSAVTAAYSAVYESCHGSAPSGYPAALCVDFSPPDCGLPSGVIPFLVITPILLALVLIATIGKMIYEYKNAAPKSDMPEQLRPKGII